jgi:hypothetical protein
MIPKTRDDQSLLADSKYILLSFNEGTEDIVLFTECVYKGSHQRDNTALLNHVTPDISGMMIPRYEIRHHFEATRRSNEKFDLSSGDVRWLIVSDVSKLENVSVTRLKK